MHQIQANPELAASQEGVAWLILRPRVQVALAGLAGVLLLVGVTLELSGVEAGVVLVWISLGIGMVYGLHAALEALRELSVDIDVLMVVGAGLAAGVGHPEEGALLLFLFVLSGGMEALAMARTRREIEALHRLMPTEALRLENGEWAVCSPDDLRAGDTIRVRPGDALPVDATVLEGQSSVDQSTLTGESMPRRVVEGDEVYAGTVNLVRPLSARVIRPAEESSLQRILSLVTEAREQREPMQRLIDRLSQPYAIGVLCASVLIMMVWWSMPAFSFTQAAYVAITFLIVLSPCALIIATPTATLATIARGARSGVLFKGGQSIDRLSRIGAVCFDKTGTLTIGRPTVSRVDAIGWSDPKRMLGLASGLETDSTHPIARAVHDAALASGISAHPITGTHHEPGRGIVGEIDGVPAAIGLYDYVEEHIPVCLRSLTRDRIQAVHHEGQISAVVAVGGPQGAAAVLVIEDPIRPSAKSMVRSLGGLGVAPVRMMTGDSPAAAEHIASQVGIDVWDASLLPEDKVRLMRETKEELRDRTQPGVAFIGDGVNDAPALAAADVAIGIGSIGSDAALESSDIVLLSDDLAGVPWALRLARRARGILRFNIVFALAVIIGMGIATLVGSLTGWTVEMWVGVLAHEGGTLFVVLNSLRLLWAPGPSHAAQIGDAPSLSSAPVPAVPLDGASPYTGGP